jgi:hypothetical protein
MLLAAVRGYSGCKVLAVSNWLSRPPDHDAGRHKARDRSKDRAREFGDAVPLVFSMSRP